MRPITGATATMVKDFYEETRGLLRDRQGHVATDERLAPFLHMALDRVPFLMASLFAMSVGEMEAAKYFATWPSSELNIDMLKKLKEQNVPETTHSPTSTNHQG